MSAYPVAVGFDLLKQEGEFSISHSLGVNTSFALAPALVLFGPNDSGKTNTLTAILSLMRGQAVPSRDLFRRPADEGELSLSIRLDLDRPDHREVLSVAVRHAASLPKTPGVLSNLEFFVDDFGFDESREPGLWVRARARETEDSDDEAEYEDSGSDEGGAAVADVWGLRAALLELVGELLGQEADSEVVVDRLMRCARLTFTSYGIVSGCHSWLAFDGPVALASANLDPDTLARIYSALERGVRYDWGLPSLVDVVSSHDLEASIDDPLFAERVLHAVTGWARAEPPVSRMDSASRRVGTPSGRGRGVRPRRPSAPCRSLV